jgi:outer membrane protein TolC
MRSSFLGLLIICFFSKTSSATTISINTKVFDLKKSIIFATEHSPSFDSLKRELSIASWEKESSRARFLPSLDLSATHGIQDSSKRTIGPWKSELNLDLTENIYDNGISKTNYKIASFKKDLAEIIFEEQKNKISLDIASQFLTYSLNEKLLEIQEKQYKNIRKQHDLISREYYQGMRTRNVFLRFKTQVSRSEIDLINAKNTLEKSKQELKRIIGVELNSEDSIEFTPLALAEISYDIPENFVNIESHLLYRSSLVKKEINELTADIVARKNLPEWFVSTGVGYGSSEYLGTNQSFTSNDRLSWNALVTVKYNFFDWGIRSRDKEVAIAKTIIQNNELNSELLILNSSLKQFMINALKMKKSYELAKELLGLEKSNLEFIEKEYRNGKIQYLDLKEVYS